MNTNQLLPVILVALATMPAAWSADDAKSVEWMKANAIRLDTPQAGHGFADMQKLKQVVGDARIVSLGEATHGTREFFQLKHRMLEFLASEMGFTIFSIEANMPEAYKLNEYVLTGKGDPKQLLEGLYFWTWNTQEVLEMILWMREFNKSGKGRVEFTGFDMQTPTVAQSAVTDFIVKYEPEYEASLRKASTLAEKSSTAQPVRRFGVATGKFPIDAARGKRAKFSGYIKTEGITSGYAGLWWRVDGQSGTLAFDNMEKRGVTGTTEWKQYSIELPVAADAKNINFGAMLTGNGTAWFDNLTVELDGMPYEGDGSIDLDFESSGQGFYLGGTGYEVHTVGTVAQNGKQSLRMKDTGLLAPKQEQPDVKGASAAWSDVVRHMDEARETYRRNKATDGDVEWAIQNARVVLQCMQMRAGQVSRDVSMAANVKWILDHSPKAKIVLWAHNGHVRADSYGTYLTLGSELRRMYGKQMVVFGFAFNQGSFQAMETGQGVHDFTVPPAPDGSLDANLAATGIPLLALDLRSAPESGPVADWWKDRHISRSIGALFSDKTASRYLMSLPATRAFDVLLFVEKTTAARKNVSE